nr:PAS domain-containing protein [Pseudobutyrivibrio sp.]
LYPHMKHKYEITGPSDVMWSVDDEIRDELRFIEGSNLKKQEYMTRLENVITRMEEMIYKEKNILFPICTRFFETEEWYNIYQDSKDYAPCLVDFVSWPEAEEYFANKKAESKTEGNIIQLPGGHFTPEQLRAVLNTIPIEISFVDENDINCFFNEGPKLFKRAGMAIDRDVFTCHPPKIEMMVRSIIDDFKSGARDSVSIWMEKEGVPVQVTYMAVRDENKKYVGTLECVQEMTEAKKHFEK